MKYVCVLFLFFTLASANKCFAQKDSVQVESNVIILKVDSIQYTIGSIKLSGNKKTKSYIIFREVSIKEGQMVSPSQLTEQLELTRQQIMNTTLFVDVLVYTSTIQNGIASINIDVKERWYLFPLPYFKLIDRNFNQWWKDQKRSLDRVNYGLKFFYNNVSGRNDKVSLDLVNGYNQEISFGYSQPFADVSLKHGFSIGYSFSRQREMNFNTINNKQAFFKLDGFVRETQRTNVGYSYRPDSKYRFYANVTYASDKINDTIIKLNPNYFPTSTPKLSFISTAATLQYFAVDYIPFPKKGYMYEVNLYNRGFNKTMNLLSFSIEGTYAIPFSKNNFIQFHNLGMVRFSNNQPFYNQGLLGYGDKYLRGMESYVMDGTAGFLSNTTVYQKLFSFIFKPPIKTKSHDKIPFTFYLKAFGDIGYAYNKQQNANTFSNKFLRSGGIGIDIISIYDFVFRIEYSFNQIGESGLAGRSRGDF